MDVDLRYRCDICTKICLRAHGAKIHSGKCRGQKIRYVTDLPWGATFVQWLSGRSPVCPNTNATGTLQFESPQSCGRWTRLHELDVKHQGKQSINLLIAAELVAKSNKQVSEKRRALFGSRAKSVVNKSVSVPAKRKTEESLARSVERVSEQAFW